MEFKIIEKNDFVVVTFKGRFSKETKKILEDCVKEIEPFESKTFALLFKDVTDLTNPHPESFHCCFRKLGKRI